MVFNSPSRCAARMKSHLNVLFDKSVHIMREAKAKYSKLGLMWAGGKDSTLMLYIAREAYYNQLPPIVFLDTTYAFRETKEFIRNLSKVWKFKIVYAQNREALAKGVGPKNCSHLECCTCLKTDALNQCIKNHKFDALMFGIRWDEHPIRGKELYFSERDVPAHMRVHPILHWTEDDVWSFTELHGVPINPLYNRVIGDKRYRSLGCYPCTTPLSNSEYASVGERGGRSQDKERIMERLRVLGYM